MEWKIQLIAHINFVSLDTGVITDFYARTKNEEVRLGNETDDIVKNLINSFLNNYQKEQQVLREKINLVFECVDLMSYQIHKTSLKRGSSHIKSPEWIANKKAIINPKNTKYSSCFAYSIIVALNHEKIKKYPERITNIIPFVDQYNWKGIDFPAGVKDWKKIEKNNETIALNILQVPYCKKKQFTCINQNNHTRKNQVVLLISFIITDGEKWHYTALKSEQTEDGFIRLTKGLSRLFKGKTSNHKGDFFV